MTFGLKFNVNANGMNSNGNGHPNVDQTVHNKGAEPSPNKDSSTNQQPITVYQARDLDLTLPYNKAVEDEACAIQQYSGATEVSQETKTIVGEHYEALARAKHRERFDPDKYLHHRIRQEEYERNDKALEEANEAYIQSTIKVRELKEKTEPAIEPNPPETSISDKICYMGALIVPIALSIQPYFVSLGDDFLAWVIAMVISLLMGWTIVSTYLNPPLYTNSEAGLRNWRVLLAPFLLGVALIGLRMIDAVELRDYLVVIGFSVWEVFILLKLAARSLELRKAQQEWLQAKQKFDQYQAQLAGAASVQSDAQLRVKTINDSINSFRDYVEELELLHQHNEQTVKVIKTGAMVGLLKGAFLNNNRRVGAGGK
jgi:hypothetical protein